MRTDIYLGELNVNSASTLLATGFWLTLWASLPTGYRCKRNVRKCYVHISCIDDTKNLLTSTSHRIKATSTYSWLYIISTTIRIGCDLRSEAMGGEGEGVIAWMVTRVQDLTTHKKYLLNSLHLIFDLSTATSAHLTKYGKSDGCIFPS